MVAARYGSSLELELTQRVSARVTAALAKELDRRSKEALFGEGAKKHGATTMCRIWLEFVCYLVLVATYLLHE